MARKEDQEEQKEIYWKYLGGNVVKEGKGVKKVIMNYSELCLVAVTCFHLTKEVLTESNATAIFIQA